MIKRKIIQFLLTFFLGAAGTIGLWAWASLTYVYSTGERAGYVQKLSKRGWVFKTWEGEMAMVNLPGAMPEKFFFTVRNTQVAEQVEKTLGHRVVLKYNQHRGVPSNIFGETSYFITDVKPVLGAEAPAPLPAKL